MKALYDIQAPAKLNTFLHVVGRRSDGYHLLQSVFMLIDWCDTLHLERRSDGQISRSDESAELELPADDLCVRAARALQAATGTALGAHIHLHKRIPAQAGMGGGSSDAAACLLALMRLFVWFMWPAWPLALWTLWQWRRQLGNRHVALPLWFFSVVCVSTLLTTASDRGLLLALPALACLAAFALPTLKRSVAALIDWFTLLFFSLCGLTIWVIWIALQTGVPKKPAANVARLAPGFEASFSLLALLVAVLASLAWAWLVKWRTGRHRSAIWKSLVLPAGGATLCWVLLMSLWLPLLDFARGYQPLVRQVTRYVDRQACAETLGLSTAQAAALRYHGNLELRVAQLQPQCPALLVDRQAQARFRRELDPSLWTLVAAARRPTENSDDLLIYRRSPRE
jgi:4-amino-4-deoxy-L-arabinose transferase-like glycosyltransferase